MPSYHCRRYGGRGLNGLAGGHSVFDQVRELGGLRAMGKRTDAASEGNLNATRNCHSSALFTQRLQAVFSAGGLGIARGVVAERIVACSKFQLDAFLFTQVCY